MNIIQNAEIKWIKDSNDEIITPFNGDTWNRQTLADQLESYVSRIKVGATIAIDAEWGAGKSWFVKHWQAQLEQKAFKVIYLNAFAQDYIDDPFLTISMEITNALNEDKNTTDHLKETIGNAYRAILPNIPMLLWSVTSTLMGAGLLAQSVTDTIKDFKDGGGDFGEKAAELLNEKLKEHLSEQIEDYEKEKQSLEHFKRELTTITEKLDTPLIFIVDELDRCKPEFAIRLIERIKHFFDIPKVVFVLAINKSQLEESINSFYGFSSSTNYLEKFIDITVLLKMGKNNVINYQKTVDQCLNNLGFTGIPEEEKRQFVNMCNVYKPNNRQIIRIFNKFSLLNNGLDTNKYIFLFLMLVFIELKLITDFNENDFIEKLMVNHRDFFDKIYRKKREESRMGASYSFYNFLKYNIYSSPGLETLIHYIENQNNKDLKNFYYPTQSLSDDLIQSWYNYIHMVVD